MQNASALADVNPLSAVNPTSVIRSVIVGSVSIMLKMECLNRLVMATVSSAEGHRSASGTFHTYVHAHSSRSDRVYTTPGIYKTPVRSDSSWLLKELKRVMIYKCLLCEDRMAPHQCQRWTTTNLYPFYLFPHPFPFYPFPLYPFSFYSAPNQYRRRDAIGLRICPKLMYRQIPFFMRLLLLRQSRKRFYTPTRALQHWSWRSTLREHIRPTRRYRWRSLRS